MEFVSKSITYVSGKCYGERKGQVRGKSILFRALREGLPEKVTEQRPGGSEGEAADALREEYARQKEQQVQQC